MGGKLADFWLRLFTKPYALYKNDKNLLTEPASAKHGLNLAH